VTSLDSWTLVVQDTTTWLQRHQSPALDQLFADSLRKLRDVADDEMIAAVTFPRPRPAKVVQIGDDDLTDRYREWVARFLVGTAKQRWRMTP